MSVIQDWLNNLRGKTNKPKPAAPSFPMVNVNGKMVPGGTISQYNPGPLQRLEEVPNQIARGLADKTNTSFNKPGNIAYNAANIVPKYINKNITSPLGKFLLPKKGDEQSGIVGDLPPKPTGKLESLLGGAQAAFNATPVGVGFNAASALAMGSAEKITNPNVNQLNQTVKNFESGNSDIAKALNIKNPIAGAATNLAFPFVIGSEGKINPEEAASSLKTIINQISKSKSLEDVSKLLEMGKLVKQEDLPIMSKVLSQYANKPKEVADILAKYPLLKNRGFVDTLKSSQNIEDELKNIINQNPNSKYMPRDTQKLSDEAAKFVNDDPEKAFNSIISKTSGWSGFKSMLDDKGIATGIHLIDFFQKNKRFDSAAQVADMVAQNLTEHGRAIQAATILNALSPEGILAYSTKLINKAQDTRADQIDKVVSDIKGSIEHPTLPTEISLDGKPTVKPSEVVKNVTDKIAEAVAKAGEKIKGGARVTSEKVVSEADQTAKDANKLGSKVINEMSPAKKKAKVNDLVNELFKIAKQSLPEKGKVTSIPKSALSLIKDMFSKDETAKSVYEMAKGVVQEKFADNPEILDALEEYEKSEANPPVSSSTVTKAVKQELASQGVKLRDIVTRSIAEQKTAASDIVQKMVQEGFTPEAADHFSKLAADELKTQMNEAKASVLRQLASKAPKGKTQDTFMEKVYKLVNTGALNDKDYRDLAAAKLRIPHLNESDSKYISEEAERVQNMAAGRDKSVAQDKLKEYIAKLIPSSFSDRAFDVWRTGLLTALRTPGKIIVSHTASNVMEKTKDVVATGLDITRVGYNKVMPDFLNIGEKKRTISFTLRGMWGGAMKGVGDAVDNFLHGYNAPGSGGYAQDFMNRTNYGDSFAGKIFDAYTKGVQRLHGSLYKPFFGSQHLNSLFDMASTEAINQSLKGAERENFITDFVGKASKYAAEHPDDDENLFKYGRNTPEGAALRANVEARYTTFQNQTVLSKILSGIKRGFKPAGNAGGYAIPFSQIPSSIAMKIIDYSPIGIPKAIFESAMDKVRTGTFDTRDFTQKEARSITGIGVAVLGYEAFMKNNISLGYPTDPTERALWAKEGRTENSIKIGGHWRQLNSIGYIGDIMLIGANFASGMQGTKQNAGNILKGLGSASISAEQGVTNAPYVQDVNAIIAALQDPSGKQEGLLKQYAGSLVPVAVSNIASGIDHWQRETNTVLDEIKSKIPGLRNHLPQKVDFTGEPIPKATGTVAALLDPTYPSDDRSSPGTRELQRLKDSGAKISLGLVSKNQTIGSGTEMRKSTLTPSQIDIITRNAGPSVKKAISDAMNNPKYSGENDDEKAADINSAVKDLGINDMTKAFTLYNIINDMPENKRQAYYKYVQDNNLITEQSTEYFKDIWKNYKPKN